LLIGKTLAMSIFSFFGCVFNRHQPLRRNVQWNGRAYIGTCRHCDAQIIRSGRRNWRRRKPDEAEDFLTAT
jgi:hypothetical protein